VLRRTGSTESSKQLCNEMPFHLREQNEELYENT